MKYSESQIKNLYESALAEANVLLSGLRVTKGRKPKGLRGLNGWVFEQTIRSCIEDELDIDRNNYAIGEQVSLSGRAKLDLVIGSVAIEIKGAGFFGVLDAEKYRGYRSAVESTGKRYVYLTAYEGYVPYRALAIDIFGKDYVFFLDDDGAWEKFISCLKKELKVATKPIDCL